MGTEYCSKCCSKRSSLLEAALVLFNEKGFQGTPTAEISKKAGVATGTLFHYFRTKEELINELYLEIKEEKKVAMSAGLEEEHTVRGKLRRIWENSIQWSLENPQKLFFFSQFHNSVYITKLTKEEAKDRYRFLLDLIEEGKKQEIIKDLSDPLLMDLVGGMIYQTSMHFLSHADDYQNPSYRDQAFSVFWDSIKR